MSFFIKIINYIKGYVQIRAQGGFPERFLNLCSYFGIPLWDSAEHDGVLYAKINPKDYKKLRGCAKKSGMKIHINKKYGLPFFLLKNKKRAGLLVGSIFFLLCLGFLSSFVWTVEVEGCETVNPDKIYEVAEALGVKQGALKRNIDREKAESEALTRLPELSWLAINIRGGHARIEVMEKGKDLPQREDKKPSDIVASKDGQIVTLEVFDGTRIQRENAAVLKGDLIISGITENRDGSVKLRKARGYVTAKTNHSVKVYEDFKNSIYKIGKTKEDIILYFFGLKLPLGKKKCTGDAFKEERFISLKGKTLPIGIIKRRSCELEETKNKVSHDELLLSASERFFTAECKELRDLKVLDSSLIVTENRLGIEICSQISTLENIGMSKNMEIEHNFDALERG